MRFTRSQWVGSVVGVAAVLFASQMASAATIVYSLRLQDTSFNNLTPVAGVYNLTAGEEVNVVLSISVSSPNLTNNTRAATATRNKPLGASVTFTSLNMGTIGVITPELDNSFSPPNWLGYTDVSVPGEGYAFVNVLNGGLTPTGAGISSSANSYALSNGSNTAKFELGLGVNGVNTTLSGQPDDINLGLYKVIGGGLTTLSTVSDPKGNTVFVDSTPNGTSNLLNSQQAPVTEASIQIFAPPVPEPATLGLVGLGGLLILARRRKA
jgi:hypothetical protein